MTFQCFECQKSIEAYPCACGYQPHSLAPVQQPLNWIIQQCTAPGCTVAIRERMGSQGSHPICKWHRSDTAYAAQGIHTEPATGSAMNRDEFGFDLYSAIKAQSGLRQAQRNVEIYERKGMKREVAHWQAIVKSLNAELSTCLESNAISNHDMKRILEIT